MTLFLVEYRQIKLKDTPFEHIECMTAHTASSFDKAVKFCKRSTEYNEHNESEPWWFTITSEEVDSEHDSELMAIISWDGKFMHEQPQEGYPEKSANMLKNVLVLNRN